MSTEAGHNSAAVEFDCFGRYVQCIRDLFGALSTTNQLKNFVLSFGQNPRRVCVAARPPGGPQLDFHSLSLHPVLTGSACNLIHKDSNSSGGAFLFLLFSGRKITSTAWAVQSKAVQ